MRHFSRPLSLVAVLALAVLVVATSGCDKATLAEPTAGSATLTGTVVLVSVDGTRSPGAGVRIFAIQCDVGTLSSGTMGGCDQHLQDSTTAAADGTYALEKLFAGSAVITTSNHPGYQAFNQNVGLPAGTHQLQIVLVPLP